MRYKVSESSSVRDFPSSRRESHPEATVVGPEPPGRLAVVVALLAVVVLSLVAAVAVLATVHLKSGQGLTLAPQLRSAQVCLSQDCILSAARILQSLDRSAQPCEDFYQFACGGWIRRNPVPESQSSWDQFRVLRGDLLVQLRELLEAKGSDDDLQPVKQARALYRTCMDTERLEQMGVRPMVGVLRQLGVGEAPPPPGDASRVRPAPFDWVHALGSAHRVLGLNVLFGFWVSQDMRNTSRNLMVVDQIPPGISERYLLQPERFETELREYRRYVRDMIASYARHQGRDARRRRHHFPSSDAADDRDEDDRYEEDEDDDDDVHGPGPVLSALRGDAGGVGAAAAAGADNYEAFADRFAADVLDYSTRLAKIMTTAEQRRDTRRVFHEMSVRDLQKLMTVPQPGALIPMNWTRYLETVFSNTNVTLDFNKDIVVVMDSTYLEKLAGLLANTDQATLERFIWWNVFSTLAPLTLQSFRDLAFRFSQRVFGLTQKTARWQGCTGNVNSNFGMAVSYLYVQKHFNNQSKAKALEMVGDIRDAFVEMVGELQWMDEETKALTLDKAHAMRPFIGFPGWLLQPGQLDKFYQGVQVKEGKLFETYLLLSERSIKKTLEDLRRSPDYNRWVTPATAVNAFYSPVLNSVTFPAGILQPPFYGLGLEALNYGAIGAIMGHELTHGFDDQGRRYDKYGNLKQWWTESTLQEYEKRVQCIVEQYNKYEVPQIGENFTVNGVNTQGENIADNGGLREALRAYRKFRTRQSDPEQLLPGLTEYSPEQLFFLGFAHMWCGNSTRGAMRSRVVEGVHSPNRFRVIGTLSNSEEFAKSWGCRKGSQMNPQHKCILW
ncbi:hypothetical protein R5R35_001640 [Gryllus longicercus]|uniref:Uncharacterized protein n=1 Tax=Gryllus longicercus TaxID=2509291 RepID=A0AAN9W0L6_9ORTH